MQKTELPRIYRAQSRLVTAVQELSLARDLPTIQDIVRQSARAIAGSDGATMVLRDGNKCHYLDEDAIGPLWKGQRFPLETCISGWAMLNGRHAVVPDIYADPRIPADAYRPTFVKSLLMVPIRVKSPIGAIGIYWARHYEPTEDEIELIQALAHTTSVALENVRVYSELEDRVAERTRQLEEANRELEAFSYSVSHDLRAPLRGINAYAELLAQQVDPNNAAAQKYLSTLQRSALKMNRLVTDMLQFATSSSAQVERAEVDLAPAARQILDRLQQAEPHRRVEIAIATTLPSKCDAGLISIVLENLLSNAWKYTSKIPNARIEVGTAGATRGVDVYFVRDNGAGFDPAHAAKLFTPFHRMHSATDFPGSGIGLATVQRILSRHGGRIWAESRVDQGATFYFTCCGES